MKYGGLDWSTTKWIYKLITIGVYHGEYHWGYFHLSNEGHSLLPVGIALLDSGTSLRQALPAHSAVAHEPGHSTAHLALAQHLIAFRFGAHRSALVLAHVTVAHHPCDEVHTREGLLRLAQEVPSVEEVVCADDENTHTGVRLCSAAGEASEGESETLCYNFGVVTKAITEV